MADIMNTSDSDLESEADFMDTDQIPSSAMDIAPSTVSDAMNIAPSSGEFDLDFVGSEYDDNTGNITAFFRDLSKARSEKQRQVEFRLNKKSIDKKQLGKYIEIANDSAETLKRIYYGASNAYYHDLKDKERKYNLRELAVVNYRKLQSESRDIVFNSQYMIIIQKLLNTILDDRKASERTHAEKVRAWIKHLSVISAGSFGRTLKAGINVVDNFFAIKYSLRAGSDLFHEYIVGSRVNMLRDLNICLGFVYTYGEFHCTKAVVVEKSKQKFEFVSWCIEDTAYPTRYLYLENITNSETMENYLTRDLNIYHSMSLFYNIFLNLSAANENIEYTHWDLHPGNILVAQHQDDAWTSVKLGSRNYYVKTFGSVPFIIDHGLASVNINGIIVGPDPTSLEGQTSNFRGFSLFFQDIYRLLFSWIDKLVRLPVRTTNNKNFTTILRQILPYFFLNGKDSYEKMLKIFEDYLSNLQNYSNLSAKQKQDLRYVREYFFFYKLPRLYNNNSSKDFLDVCHKHIIAVYPDYKISEIFISDKQKVKNDRTVLSCNDMRCKPRIQIENGLSKTPESMQELCYYGSDINTLSTNTQNKIIMDFNNEVKNIANRIDRNITSAQNFFNLDHITLIRNVDYNIFRLNHKNFYGDLEDFYIKLVNIWHGYYDLVNNYHNLNCAAKDGVLQKIKDNLYKRITQFSSVRNTLFKYGVKIWNELKLSYGGDKKFINDVNSANFYKNDLDVVLYIIEHDIIL